MKICGIIAEYDPLHNGHAWHLSEARRNTQADCVICVMSGCFTQRGMPALLSPHVRAEMALRAGADIVLQPPVSYSVCDGLRFALGGVSILQRLGAQSISFGAEETGIPWIAQAADLLETPSLAFQQTLHDALNRGVSFPAAQGEALAETLQAPSSVFSLPNTVLAICYARAVRRLKADMTLFPVRRRGDYHASDLNTSNDAALPSATAVRQAVLADKWNEVEQAMPSDAFKLLQGAFQQGCVHLPNALDGMLRWRLRQTKYPTIPDISEGLENRFAAASEQLSRDAMVHAIKSKRYPYTRINRMLTHLLLETDAAKLSQLPQHAYILGFKREFSPLLKLRGDSDLQLMPALSPGFESYEMSLDERADALWALGAHQPFGEIYRKKPVIL